MAEHVVATLGEIPPGGRKIAEVEGRSIGVFNLNGRFFALLNRCPHQGGPLCLGQQSGLLQARVPGEYRYTRIGEIVRCPWHGWEFDLKTGRSWFDPARTRVRNYRVRVETRESECSGVVRRKPDPGRDPIWRKPIRCRSGSNSSWSRFPEPRASRSIRGRRAGSPRGNRSHQPKLTGGGSSCGEEQTWR